MDAKLGGLASKSNILHLKNKRKMISKKTRLNST